LKNRPASVSSKYPYGYQGAGLGRRDYKWGHLAMAHRPVHWHEGMFLRPHHFQAAQRHWQQWANTSEKWDCHYNWGLRSIKLDLDALPTFRLLIRSLKARLRDGTLISTEEDGQLTPMDLREALAQEPVLTVYLAIPLFELSKANIGAGDGARYSVESQDLEDENKGANPQPIQVRRMNFKLLLSTQSASGYEVLPIARIRKAADGTPERDKEYIPPVLTCDAWQWLREELLDKVAFRIKRLAEELAKRMMKGGIMPGIQGAKEQLLIDQLRILNEASAILSILNSADGVHPLEAYLELWRIAGQLAVFHKQSRRTPDLVPYDHDDIWRCFKYVIDYIDARLDDMRPTEIIEIPFRGEGLHMAAPLEPRFLEAGWQMYVAAKSRPRLSPGDCNRILNKRLEMKIASALHVDDFFRDGVMGLSLTFCQQTPHDLETYQDCSIFQIDRSSQPNEWAVVQSTMHLGIRLNSRHDVTGQPAVNVSLEGGQALGFQFWLLLVPSRRT
jgi:type VI secretion system protein ImpJ